MYLPDINVWLALAFEVHSGHHAARTWFESLQTDICSFCRITQAGFLRIATNPTVFPDDACTLADAWMFYHRFLADPRIRFEPEPTGLDHLWQRYTTIRSFSHKIWNDAYLAAFANAGSLRIVTFDRGFTAYQGVGIKLLLAT